MNKTLDKVETKSTTLFSKPHPTNCLKKTTLLLWLLVLSSVSTFGQDINESVKFNNCFQEIELDGGEYTILSNQRFTLTGLGLDFVNIRIYDAQGNRTDDHWPEFRYWGMRTDIIDFDPYTQTQKDVFVRNGEVYINGLDGPVVTLDMVQASTNSFDLSFFSGATMEITPIYRTTLPDGTNVLAGGPKSTLNIVAAEDAIDITFDKSACRTYDDFILGAGYTTELDGFCGEIQQVRIYDNDANGNALEDEYDDHDAKREYLPNHPPLQRLGRLCPAYDPDYTDYLETPGTTEAYTDPRRDCETHQMDFIIEPCTHDIYLPNCEPLTLSEEVTICCECDFPNTEK